MADVLIFQPYFCHIGISIFINSLDKAKIFCEIRIAWCITSTVTGSPYSGRQLTSTREAFQYKMKVLDLISWMVTTGCDSVLLYAKSGEDVHFV